MSKQGRMFSQSKTTAQKEIAALYFVRFLSVFRHNHAKKEGILSGKKTQANITHSLFGE
jgi:hypothetical protein